MKVTFAGFCKLHMAVKDNQCNDHCFQRLAQECVQQNTDNARYCRIPVHTPKPPGDPAANQPPAAGTQSFQQYLTVVQSQIACAKEIHDTLLESAKKLSERSTALTQQQIQAAQQQQQQQQQQMLSQQQQQQQLQQQM